MERPEAASPRRDVRVLLVDDTTYFRTVMSQLVAATPGFTLVGDVTCGEEALAATLELSPEFLVMDIHTPGTDGLTTARLMAERHPHVVILLVSALAPDDIAAEISGMVSFAAKSELSASLLQEVWGQQQARREDLYTAYSG